MRHPRRALALIAAPILACLGLPAHAAGFEPFGVPFEFVLFALTLLGVALFHHKTFEVSMTEIGRAHV